jgi:hypothetical protein
VAWWEWVTYAKDPVARDMLAQVLVRLAAFAPPPPADSHVEAAPVPRGLDCGHTHHAYAIYRDGQTSCYDCYRPTRGNTHGSI